MSTQTVEPKKYMQRVGRPTGPSLDDFIYRKSVSLDIDKNVIYNGACNADVTNAFATNNGYSFTPRSEFTFDRSITWYPAHMAKAKLNIGKKKQAVDCILEVRDARAPLTSSNCSLVEEYPDHIPRLVVLNKSDLVLPKDIKRSCELLEKTGRHAVAYSALGLRRITQIIDFVTSKVTPKYKTLGVWMMVVGLPNATTAAEAGSTRHMNAFFVSEKPKLYCFDTPGVMLPKMNCPEINLVLAAIGCVNDHRAGVDYIADYILYRLNRNRMFKYVDILGMQGPTDDVTEIMEHISQIAERKYGTIEPSNCYRIFINQFRLGRFGRICMDDLSDIMRRGDLSDFELRYAPLCIYSMLQRASRPIGTSLLADSWLIM
uniref:Uncharacterized protein n=1 Tax=Babesia bovis TaxID=5865 RepID=A7AQ26_BABBO|eukprot:XP_001612228.1 hypothetical protein [Babesia bovis T2Bo]